MPPLPSARPASPALQPPNGWAGCTPDELAGILAEGGWHLVEFWAPDNLFARLLAPVRVMLPQSHAGRLRLLCCTVDEAGLACALYGVAALPALVLFDGTRRAKRWIGAFEPSLMRYEIDFALADAAR